MERFKSKIDFWLPAFLVLIFGAVLITLLYDQNWFGFAFILFVIAFIVHMFLTTYYIIDSEKLTIKCGFFFKKVIDIKAIKRISESYNIISSPALSFNRIEILYNKFDAILISPIDKRRFIESIEKINPEAEIKTNPKV